MTIFSITQINYINFIINAIFYLIKTKAYAYFTLNKRNIIKKLTARTKDGTVSMVDKR